MSTALNFYRGSTFNFAGTLQLDGAIQDFTGWTITANLSSADGTTVITPITINSVDPVNGLFAFTTGSTSLWPIGKARIDVQVVTNLGQIILSGPTYLRILESPMV